MKFDKLVSDNRFAACVALVATLWFGSACKKGDNAVVVRILLPPSSSPLREEITKLQYSRLKTDGGREIVPATMETIDDAQFRKFLQDVQVYRPQIVVVPSSDDIPANLQGQSTSATLRCSAFPSNCVSVLTPWGNAEEQWAARLVQRSIGVGKGRGEAAAGGPG
jgi:hypothetical protein